MERRDYILMEIEKIGVLLRGILNRLTGKEEKLAISIENQFSETKDLILNDIGFDFEKFFTLNEQESKDYIAEFKGINPDNLELLAEIVYFMGKNDGTEQKRIILKKALWLYELCSEIDRSFSMERENKIAQIKNSL